MTEEASIKQSPKRWSYIWAIVRYSAWVLATFVAATLVISLAILLIDNLGIKFNITETTLSVAIGAIMYVFMLAILVGVPWLIWKQRTSLRILGLHKLTSWKDIGLGLAGMVGYFVLTAILMVAVVNIFTGIDIDQAQDLGGIKPQSSLELMIVFALLVVIGPVVEELIFRGYLYGKIRQSGAPFWLTALVVSVLFGAVHMQWNVAVDTFALSLVMCLTREATGTLWPSILMHMSKNGIAFYVLFIAGGISSTLGA